MGPKLSQDCPVLPVPRRVGMGKGVNTHPGSEMELRPLCQDSEKLSKNRMCGGHINILKREQLHSIGVGEAKAQPQMRAVGNLSPATLTHSVPI